MKTLDPLSQDPDGYPLLNLPLRNGNHEGGGRGHRLGCPLESSFKEWKRVPDPHVRRGDPLLNLPLRNGNPRDRATDPCRHHS